MVKYHMPLKTTSTFVKFKMCVSNFQNLEKGMEIEIQLTYDLWIIHPNLYFIIVLITKPVL